jgi:hypothetical protein
MPVDVEKFTKHLRAHALKNWGKGKCGQWVREALQAGGAEIRKPYPATGKEYGPTLLRLGFRRLVVENPDTFNFQKGDVMVMEPYKGGKPAGHVAAYDGRNWISDFIQHDFWAGPGYRNEKPSYAVYRP